MMYAMINKPMDWIPLVRQKRTEKPRVANALVDEVIAVVDVLMLAPPFRCDTLSYNSRLAAMTTFPGKLPRARELDGRRDAACIRSSLLSCKGNGHGSSLTGRAAHCDRDLSGRFLAGPRRPARSVSRGGGIRRNSRQAHQL